MIDSPPATDNQRGAALAEANDRRGKRAKLWRRWKELSPRDAHLELAALIADDDPPDYLSRIEIGPLLRHVPSVGRVKIERYFAGLSLLSKRLEELDRADQTIIVGWALARARRFGLADEAEGMELEA